MTTLGDLIRLHTDQLTAPWFPNRGRTIRRVVAWRLGCEESWLFAHPEEDASPLLEQQLQDDIRLLNEGYPLDYLLGSSSFLYWDFKVDSRALCPREETAELCELIISRLKSCPPDSVLDLGCGSGVIGLSLALAFERAQVTLVDSSSESIELARENAGIHGLQSRTHIARSDWFSQVDGTFDLIVSNPPYVAFDDEVDPGVKRFEPEQALYCGDGGMAQIKLILNQIASFLAQGGVAAFELGHRHHRELDVKAILGPDWQVQWLDDGQLIPRFLWLQR